MDLSATSAFVNLGGIDRLNGTVLLPADFTDFGVVLEPRNAAVRAVSRSGSTVTIQVTGDGLRRAQLTTAAQHRTPGGFLLDIGSSQA